MRFVGLDDADILQLFLPFYSKLFKSYYRETAIFQTTFSVLYSGAPLFKILEICKIVICGAPRDEQFAGSNVKIGQGVSKIFTFFFTCGAICGQS